MKVAPISERPVTVTIGSNKLTNLERLVTDIDSYLSLRHRVGQVYHRFGTARHPGASSIASLQPSYTRTFPC